MANRLPEYASLEEFRNSSDYFPWKEDMTGDEAKRYRRSLRIKNKIEDKMVSEWVREADERRKNERAAMIKRIGRIDPGVAELTDHLYRLHCEMNHIPMDYEYGDDYAYGNWKDPIDKLRMSRLRRYCSTLDLIENYDGPNPGYTVSRNVREYSSAYNRLKKYVNEWSK